MEGGREGGRRKGEMEGGREGGREEGGRDGGREGGREGGRKGELGCFLTSANSGVSLNGELSKPRLFPGEFASTKPKSMWMMCPSESTRMLPLCLQSRGEQHLHLYIQYMF